MKGCHLKHLSTATGGSNGRMRIKMLAKMLKLNTIAKPTYPTRFVPDKTKPMRGNHE